MVIIRLSRTGRKNVATYRVMVADSRKSRDGRFIEKIGQYNPVTKPALCQIDHARALYWLAKGAQPTDTVRSIFHRDGILKKWQLAKKGLDASTVTVEKKYEKAKKHPKRRKSKDAKKAEAAPAPAAAAS